jgi:threonyl-tRNA synthetase
MAATVENLERLQEKAREKMPEDAHEWALAFEESLRFGIKPMNCPSHCLIYRMTKRSYRDLPMRMADFGRLHRFERSGVVQGLTRVRTFAQDDAHIFCTLEQVQDEIKSFLDLVYDAYRDFGFTDVRIVIATRPEKRLGARRGGVLWTEDRVPFEGCDRPSLAARHHSGGLQPARAV